LRSIRDVELKDKRVLMRVDFNVPMDEQGQIIDDHKMVAALPTIKYVLGQGARLIIMSHLGRPNGKPDVEYSLKEVAAHLGQLLSQKVLMAPDCIGPKVEEMAQELAPGEILMLENVRFHPGEEKNDPEFSRQLAQLGEVYVNDAFGTAHRAHSSTSGVANFLPAYAGFLLENEVNMLRKVLEHPKSPRMAILGGAKIKDKLGLILNLLDKMDVLLLGGGIGSTFLCARGIKVGKSICEAELLQEARDLLDLAARKGKVILMPVDVVVAAEISAGATTQVVDVHAIPDDMMIVDIGPKTLKGYSTALSRAQTIIWNGPVGIYEYPQFAIGTEGIARAIASSSAVSVIGGGSSAAAIHQLGLEKSISHISTGGGATLEFLEGIELPGVKSVE
jgi:phosphoglycerate kinase